MAYSSKHPVARSSIDPSSTDQSSTDQPPLAKFHIGMAVRHRIYGFRGVVFDVDPEFDNTEEWYDNIPEDVRPRKNQPFYHLFAETQDKSPYVAYVSEQNLEPDEEMEPIHHPGLSEYFDVQDDGSLALRNKMN